MSIDNQYSPHFISDSDIAIIGISCRFPGAKDANELWKNLQNGVESISFFSDQELVSSGVDPALLRDPDYVRAKAILPDIKLFDASFFDISPAEAEMMDPQQRLFLECAWQAIESAGYSIGTYSGSIAVYAGAGINTYLLSNLISNLDLLESARAYRAMISNDKDFLSTRVSYKLNLKGPSVNVQTACSTSLVAAHLGCQSLINGECDMALVGGVSIRVPQKTGYLYQEDLILSPNGQCRAFDAQAQGTVGGNGLGIVVLKRLTDAIADGDYVYATIKGSAINNDGSLKVGYTAPSIEGQASVISEAQAIAGIDAGTVTYIEAHGTGTVLGDPIEIAGLSKAFQASKKEKQFCAIGSIKTNLGHLDAAAGVAGLIKTALSLKHKQIPPSLHFEHPNPQIDFANSPFYVNTQLSQWEANGTPLRAGVSSFGIGGTNAHIVLEEAPPREPSGKARPWQLLALSAKTNTALDQATANLAEHLRRNPELNLADIAYTLSQGRQMFNHRRILVCEDIANSATPLETLDPKRILSHSLTTGEQPVVFMFSGQGAQYVNMGLELYQHESTFREQVDICSELLNPHLGFDLRHILYPSQERTAEAEKLLNQTAIAQPSLFVLEYALAKLWISWGVHPKAMIGHSLGEYVAACLADVFSLEEALSLVATRGRLMQQMPSGAMLTVSLPVNEVEPFLSQEISLAVINGPSLCVVSGSSIAVEDLQAQLTQRGIEHRRLKTSHAFHSTMMEPMLGDFIETIQKVSLKPPKIPYLSNVTGSWITASEATDPTYWSKHLRQTVHFAHGLQQLLQDPSQILLEVGPGRTLSTLAMRHPERESEQVVLTSVRHPKDSQSDMAFLLTTLGKLWLNGAPVNWSAFYSNERRYRLPLPTYPFERQHYWIAPSNRTEHNRGSHRSIEKKSDIADWFYLPLWKQSISPSLPDQADLTAQLTAQISCWLVFSDEGGLAAQIVKRLEEWGQDVITVSLGSGFAKQSNGRYLLNPQQSDGYNLLLSDLLAQGRIPQKILHLWSVTEKGHTCSILDSLDKAQNLGFRSLLHIAQAIGQQNFTDPIQLSVISNDLWDVTGEEELSPEKAMLLGPIKVIPKEYPNIGCQGIDVVIPSSGTRCEQRLVNQLLTELINQSSDPVIAYRGSHRWAQIFEPVRLEMSTQVNSRLREGGVYLITGGLGGIGLALADYLAKTVRAKLILIGRSAMPARNEWERWLATHDQLDPISRKIRAIQELEDRGAEVLVMSADVTHEPQMQAAIAAAQQQFGGINGVIHAAGVPGGGMIQRKKLQQAEEILAPKVKGTLILDALFEETRLDFFVLCSALTSIFGTFGQADYCSANAFLDAFAHHKTSQQSNTFTLSVNWDAWQEVGMAVNTALPSQLQALHAEQLRRGILPQEGADVFSRLLGSAIPHVLVSTLDLLSRVDQEHNLQALETAEKTEQFQPIQERIAQAESTYPRPTLSNAYVPPKNELEQSIADIWQQLLGIDQVGIHDDFFDLGGDSLLGTQVISRMRQTFQVNLPLNCLFGDPTVAGIAEYLGQIFERSQQNQVPTNDALGEREEISL